jgi:Putative beta-lactamase-inhibitor-like, PepSY-like
MKNLQFLLIALFSATFMFTACESTDIIPLDDSAYLDLTFMATADSSHTHKGGSKGEKGKMNEIDPATLPASVTAYITTTYAGSTVKHAAKTESGKFVVHLILADKSNKGLVFDETGKFLSAKNQGKNKGVKVEISALPKAVTDYITTTYPGSKIKKAYKSDTGNFGVEVEKADKTKVMVGFDATGKFLSELAHKHDEKKKGPKKN